MRKLWMAVALIGVMATGSFVQAQVTETAGAKAVFQVIQEVSQQGWGFIAPDAALDYIDNVDPFILDVRTPKEWDETGVIPGAVTIPVTELEQHLAELPSLNKPILVYCAAGARGQYALTYLKALGYKNVKNLKGGFTAWANAGLPVEKK